MTESNQKKEAPTSFSLDPELLRQLRISCAKRGVKQKVAVKEAIERWLDEPQWAREPVPTEDIAHSGYQSLPNSDDPDITKTDLNTLPDKGVNSDKVIISTSREEAQWVHRFLKVLRSDKPGLPVAAKNNMEEFSWAADAFNELRSKQSPLATSAGAGAGERGGTSGKLAAAVPDRGATGGDRRPEDDLRERVQELVQSTGPSKKRKKGPPGKTG